MDSRLERLYQLVLIENEQTLSDEQCREYVALFDQLREENVEIPFGVEI